MSGYAFVYFEYWRVGVSWYCYGSLEDLWSLGSFQLWWGWGFELSIISCQSDPIGPGLSFVLEWMHWDGGLFSNSLALLPSFVFVSPALRNFTTAVLQELSHNAVLKVNCTFWSCNCGLLSQNSFFSFWDKILPNPAAIKLLSIKNRNVDGRTSRS